MKRNEVEDDEDEHKAPHNNNSNRNSNSVVMDEGIPLDNNVLSTMISSFIKCDPKEEPFVLPSFRISQLILKISTPISRDSEMCEALASYYCLCLHYSITPYLEDELISLSSTAIQFVLVESFIVLCKFGLNKIRLVHPKILFGVHEIKIESTVMRNELVKGYDLMKEMSREVLRHLRVYRPNPGKGKEKVEKPPFDCFKAHSLLLVSSVALCHMACLLKISDNLNAVVGIQESLLLMASLILTDKEIAEQKTTTDSSSIFKTEVIDRYNTCAFTVNSLGYFTLNAVVTERNLQEVFLI